MPRRMASLRGAPCTAHALSPYPPDLIPPMKPRFGYSSSPSSSPSSTKLNPSLPLPCPETPCQSILPFCASRPLPWLEGEGSSSSYRMQNCDLILSRTARQRVSGDQIISCALNSVPTGSEGVPSALLSR
jgi:hypothetical protein